MIFAALLDRPKNNLNLIRLIASLLVTFSHAFILTGHLKQEPFLLLTGDQTFGYIAVFIFFVISGLLISRSFDHNSNIYQYIGSRVLRIYPALLSTLLLCALPLGLWLTTLTADSYIRNREVLRYVTDNLLFNINHRLPGVFDNLVDSNSVNGSLWTLGFEVYAYLLVILFGGLGLLRNKNIFNLSVVGLILLYAKEPVGFLLVPAKWDAPIFMPLLGFLFGISVYVNRIWIECKFRYIILAAIIYIVFRHSALNVPIYAISIGYLVLAIGFHPKLQLNILMKNDYSYGIYVYSFPIQQVTMSLLPTLAPWQHFLISLLFVIPLAVVSWHFLEKPALRLKKYLPQSIP